MGIVDDVTNSVNEQIDVLNELNPAIKVVLSFVFTAIGYYIIKYAVVRPWGRVVMSTDTAWDDKLHLSLIHI